MTDTPDMNLELFTPQAPNGAGTFRTDRQYAIDQSADAMWEALYRASFPTFASMEYVEHDGWAQRAGIDRLVILTSGRVLTIDEKIRRPKYAHKNDVFLEYRHIRSSTGRREQGWIAKDLACDYVAYGWETRPDVLLLPWHQLRKAWSDHRVAWLEKYPRERPDKGEGFTTEGACVPIQELIDAMAATIHVNKPPEKNC